MQHLDEGTIHAWLDGELPLAERESAELHVASCAECAAAVAEARGFIAASSRILTALDAVPGGVLPGADRSSGTPSGGRTSRRFIISRAWMAVAAVLVLGIGTVIATRPGADVPALRVAEDRAQAKTASAPQSEAPVAAARPVPGGAPTAMDTVVAGNAAPAPAVAEEKRRDEPTTVRERSRTIARKDAQAVTNDSTPLMIAQAAAPRAPAPSAENAPAPAARANEADAKAEYAPAAVADSSGRRALALSQVVITGQGRTSSAAPANGVKAADSSALRVVSRTTKIVGADSVVTTIYDVQGVRVSLIEWPAIVAPQVSGRSSFSDAVMAKSRAAPPVEHSITWSDSTGRTRTLRGAMTEAGLERLKAELFGATP